MQIGAITGYIDLAQIILYMFWIFFAGIIFYLVREGHREGYPMETDGGGTAPVTGWPIPSPKTYKLANGHEVTVPDLKRGEPPINLRRTGAGPDWPYVPADNGMTDAVGPGAYALRADRPDMDVHGQPTIQPLRVLKDYDVSKHDSDPRGMNVVGADGKVGGKVVDLWIDTCEMMFRYLEVQTAGAQSRRVLLPMPFCRVGDKTVAVQSIHGAHFAQVPTTRSADQVTLLEEDKISAFYGAGTLYADPSRAEPIL